MPDDPDVTVSFEHLARLLDEGVEDIYPDGARHRYKVQGLLGVVAVDHKRSEAEFLSILKEIITDYDTRESALVKANRIVTLQPNFFGLGVDINSALDTLFLKKGNRKRKVRQPKKQ